MTSDIDEKQREKITFRVWDEISEKMYYPEDAKYCVTMTGNVCHDETDDGGILENRDYRTKAMLWIGLRDKNGGKVYQGDIVLCHDNKKIHEVKYEIGDHGFCDRLTCGFEFHTSYHKNVEVIGNIHENPELLVKL